MRSPVKDEMTKLFKSAFCVKMEHKIGVKMKQT